MSRDKTAASEWDLATQPPERTTLLVELRHGTRAAHMRMETNAALAALMSPDLSSVEYVFALRGLQRLHAGIAARLRTVPEFQPIGCTFDAARLARLDEDLAWFNARPAPPLNMSRCIIDEGSALGALYVLEGSALGARIIAKAVRASLAVEPGKGGSFFCSATADTARRRWVIMSECINRFGASMDAAKRHAVIKSANAVFSALERSMKQDRVPQLLDAGPVIPQSRTHLASATIVQPATTGQQLN